MTARMEAVMLPARDCVKMVASATSTSRCGRPHIPEMRVALDVPLMVFPEHVSPVASARAFAPWLQIPPLARKAARRPPRGNSHAVPSGMKLRRA